MALLDKDEARPLSMARRIPTQRVADSVSFARIAAEDIILRPSAANELVKAS